MTHEQIAVNILTFVFCGIYFVWSCHDLGIKRATKDFVLAALIATGINYVVHSILAVTK